MTRRRCFGDGKPFYEKYHDEEWGVPEHNDRKLFELLVLEGTQAGLSWELVLKKRPAYRKAFHRFDPTKVAKMSDRELNALLKNPDLIRNKLKIYAARKNARVVLEIQEEFGSFDAYLWAFVDHEPIVNRWKTCEEMPCESPQSMALSKDLKKRGMTFVGPTILYSFMQAVGLVDDHLASCWRALR